MSDRRALGSLDPPWYRPLLVLLLGVLAALPPGCRKPDPSSTGRAGTAQKPGPGPRPPARRPGFHEVRSLVREQSRLELDAQGLFIDFGNPDQHKYTLGGWYNGWVRPGRDGETDFVELLPKARLSFHAWRGDIQTVVLRARSLGEPRPFTLINREATVGSGIIPVGAWATVTVRLEPTIPKGRRMLHIKLADATDASVPTTSKPPVQVDWIWLQRGPGKPPKPGKVAVLSFGDPRRSLVADPPRATSFYLEVPPKAQLAFDYAAERDTEFQVQVGADGPKPQVLFKKRASGGPWQSATLDLQPFTGRLIRLDFMTHAGPAGPGKAGWGEPAIVRPGPLPWLPPVPPKARPRHVIHVLVDALRMDRHRPFRPTARLDLPVFAGLAKNSTLFANAYTNGNWTLPSVSSLLSGQYPHLFAQDAQLTKVPEGVPLLPEHLQRHGFQTVCIAANPYISKSFGLGRGWTLHKNLAKPEDPADGEQVFDEAIAWLEKEENRKKRFYMYLHTMEPHAPYTLRKGITEALLPRPYAGPLGPVFTNQEVEQVKAGKRTVAEGDRPYVAALYDGDIVHHDRLLGRFLKALDRLKLAGNTLLIFSNDHGEEIFDRGHLGHGHTFYEELVRSPLLVRYPPLFPPGRRVPQPTELVDLAPTILEVLGLPPLGRAHGTSLRLVMHGVHQQMTHYIAIPGPAWVVRVGAFKLIQSPVGDSLYNVMADPGETKDLHQINLVARRTCEIYLAEAIAMPQKAQRLSAVRPLAPYKREEALLDDATRTQLKALGYIQ